MKDHSSLIKVVLSMCIFGTIGLFRRLIPYPSSVIAACRGLIGGVFVLLLMLLRREKPNRTILRKHLLPLLISGIFLGANWVLLFEAYRFTSVSVATVCYYMAPVFAALAAPVFFKDQLSRKSLFCILLSCIGMILISGLTKEGLNGLLGCLYGLGAAVLYASILLINRAVSDVKSFDRTAVQLLISAIAVGLYSIFTEDVSSLSTDPSALGLLLLVGILHTGVAYALYFDGMKRLPTQTIAIFSYIDPVLSVLLSAALLHESLPLPAWIGVLFVLSGAILSEVPLSFHKK